MINWKCWRKMWRLRIERYYADVWTPWFCIRVRTGKEEEDLFWDHWHGVRVHWGHTPGWNYLEGDIAFHTGDVILGPEYRPKQRWM